MVVADDAKKLSTPVADSLADTNAKTATARNARIANVVRDLLSSGHLFEPTLVPKHFHRADRRLRGTISSNLLTGDIA